MRSSASAFPRPRWSSPRSRSPPTFWILLEVAFDAAEFDATSLHPQPGSASTTCRASTSGTSSTSSRSSSSRSSRRCRCSAAGFRCRTISRSQRSSAALAGRDSVGDGRQQHERRRLLRAADVRQGSAGEGRPCCARDVADPGPVGPRWPSSTSAPPPSRSRLLAVSMTAVVFLGLSVFELGRQRDGSARLRSASRPRGLGRSRRRQPRRR